MTGNVGAQASVPSSSGRSKRNAKLPGIISFYKALFPIQFNMRIEQRYEILIFGAWTIIRINAIAVIVGDCQLLDITFEITLTLMRLVIISIPRCTLLEVEIVITTTTIFCLPPADFLDARHYVSAISDNKISIKTSIRKVLTQNTISINAYNCSRSVDYYTFFVILGLNNCIEQLHSYV